MGVIIASFRHRSGPRRSTAHGPAVSVATATCTSNIQAGYLLIVSNVMFPADIFVVIIRITFLPGRLGHYAYRDMLVRIGCGIGGNVNGLVSIKAAVNRVIL